MLLMGSSALGMCGQVPLAVCTCAFGGTGSAGATAPSLVTHNSNITQTYCLLLHVAASRGFLECWLGPLGVHAYAPVLRVSFLFAGHRADQPPDPTEGCQASSIRHQQERVNDAAALKLVCMRR